MDTIRQQLGKVSRVTFGALASAIAIGTVLGAAGHDQIAIYLIMSVGVAAVVYANIKMKCPKCGHSLVLMLNFGTAFPVLQRNTNRENFCPGCGARLDEPV